MKYKKASGVVDHAAIKAAKHRETARRYMGAIDRLVHDATILEFTGESVRTNATKKRQI